MSIVRNLVNKKKDFNPQGEILGEYDTKCIVDNIDDTYRFMQSIGYKELFRITDTCLVYTNGISELIIQLVNDKYIFIEMEDNCKRIDKTYDTVQEMIDEFDSYSLDYDRSSYFVQKALVVYNELTQASI
jgi:hypothetical protein